MSWHEAFPIWYIGCFLIVFGVLMIWKGQAINSCKRFFYFELRDPKRRDRLAAVLERRCELEGDNTTAWRITGFSAVLFGGLVLARLIAPVVGYALLCADLAIIMSQIYLSMRNRSPRRAASLQPRTLSSAVPFVWFVGGAVSAILPLAMWIYPASRGAAVIVAIATATIVVVALRTAQMAALLAGDDPEVELYVDGRLRWSRVTGLLTLAYAVSFVFIQMSGPAGANPPLIVAADAASAVLVAALWIWALAVFFRGRLRMNALVA